MKRKKYKKITKEKVLETLIDCNLDTINSMNVVSIPKISSLLQTSKYQVRKYMKELKKDGLVEVDYFYIFDFDDYENRPPMKGFCITKKTRELLINKVLKYEMENF